MMNRMRTWVAMPLSEDGREGGELIWVAGHSALGESGEVESEGFEAQLALSMHKLERTLHQAGASWPDILSARIYVPRPADLEGIQERLGQFLREPWPALTILCPALRPGLLFEIECVALRPRPNKHVGG